MFALLGLVIYLGWCRRDVLARRMAVWGVFAGGLGFSLGQGVQAFHAWNATEVNAVLGWMSPHINWWNMMETSFGAIFGAILALGLWRNRSLIAYEDANDAVVELPAQAEWFLILAHAAVLTAWSFGSFEAFDRLAGLAITVGLLPMVAIMGGRWWPYALSFFLVCLPIAGKTLKALLEQPGWEAVTGAPIGLFLILPLAFTAVVSIYLAKRSSTMAGVQFARIGLLVMVWVFMSLNWAFFKSPWPWEPWTGRTPNGLIFAMCAVGLTVGALVCGRQIRANQADVSD